MEVFSIFMLISATILLGYLGNLFYDKTKVPDLIWLLGFGIILGPVFHLYDPAPFIEISTLMSAVALSIILFEAGITVSIGPVIQAIPKAMALIGFTFTLTVISVGYFLHFYMPEDFTLLQGFLLGTMVGGTSTVTTIGILHALESTLDISDVKILLTLESVLTDPICIIAAITLIQMILLPSVSFSEGVLDIIIAFIISSVIGFFIGVVWALILNILRGKPLKYMITIAVLFATYMFSDKMGGHGAGPMAALVFGLVLSNFRYIFRFLGKDMNIKIDRRELIHFHEEVTFFIKSFFFVYVGLILTVSSKHVVTGFILIGICLTVRFFSASMASIVMKFSKVERALSRFIFAHGLPALIMSQLPSLYDPKRQYFPAPEIYSNLCFIIVLGTVLYGAVVGPLIVKRRIA